MEQAQQALVEKQRRKAGRQSEPTVGILDAQSTKTTMVARQQRGLDAARKVKGRKRPIIVDTLGLLLAVAIQSASVQDRNGADEVIEWTKQCWQKVGLLFADAGYSGKLVERMKKAFGIEVQIVKNKEAAAFQVLPKRWIVERTFAWLDSNRRNSKRL